MLQQTYNRIFLTLAVGLFCAASLGAEPVTTSFSYQGRLEQAGLAANGLFDFRVVAFDSLEFGNQVGPVVVLEDVEVLDGLVDLDVDLGPDVFSGERRWVQIEVRAGSDTGTFTTLQPRQEIKAGPYTLHAKNSDTIGHQALETGTVGDCSTSGSTGTSGTVVFETPFATIPRILTTADESANNSGCIAVRLQARSTTEFSWSSYGTTSLSECDCFHWLAIGER